MISRITATGHRTEVEGRTLEYGISAGWPDDIAPRVAVHFRWGRASWCPISVVLAAAQECSHDPELPLQELDALSDREWVRLRIWRPRAVPPQQDAVSGRQWLVTDVRGGLQLVVRREDAKRDVYVPFDVLDFVSSDVVSWAELHLYATALLRANGTSLPISRVGAYLEGNGGRPRWKGEPPAADYVGTPLWRVVATGRKVRVDGRTLEFGMSASWHGEFHPLVVVYFRWDESGWCPLDAAWSAIAACFDDTDEPIEEAEPRATDDLVLPTKWQPRPCVWQESEDSPFSWRIQSHDGVLRLQVASMAGKDLSTVPLSVAKFLSETDSSLWSDLRRYAEALLWENGKSLPMSRIAEWLRENDGQPRWANTDTR